MITQAFRDSVASNDVLGVKIMLKDILIIDPTFKEFDEMVRFAEENLADSLWEKYNSNVGESTSAVSEDNLDMEMVLLINNFSKERVANIKSLIKQLYPRESETAKSIDISKGIDSNRRLVRKARIEELEEELISSYTNLKKIISEARKYKQISVYEKAAAEAKQLAKILEKCADERLEIRNRSRN